MHPTAMQNGQSFFDAYTQSFSDERHVKVVEIGSQNVNGTLRDCCPKTYEYIGVDFQEANGVDIVLTNPYVLPFADNSIDVVLSSSCFEHSEMFWLVFLEIMRVLKPKGIFYLNAPSSGGFHRYPVDCWRFYPDSGQALITWGKRNNINPILLESYTQVGGGWQDYIAVFLKDESHLEFFTHRILDNKKDFENGQKIGNQNIFNHADMCQHDVETYRLTALVNQSAVEIKTDLNNHELDIQQLKVLHQEAISQLEQEIKQLKNSTSWRITSLLRRVKDLFS